MKFCISSNINFWNKTFPIIVPSLINSKISPSDIYFFIGGSNNYEKIDSDINLFYSDNNSFDFTALIGILDLNIKADHWFLMHDTCFVGLKFLEKVMSHAMDTETIRLYSGTSMNIGVYAQKYVESVKDKILSYKNQKYDSSSIQLIKNKLVADEDIFFKNSKCKSFTNNRRCEGPLDFYKNGVSRIIEHYDDLDFNKVKANWDTKPIYEIKL